MHIRLLAVTVVMVLLPGIGAASPARDRLAATMRELAQVMVDYRQRLVMVDEMQRMQVAQGKLSAAQADANLASEAGRLFRLDLTAADRAALATAHRRGFEDYLGAVRAAIAASNRWPKGGAADVWRPLALAELERLSGQYSSDFALATLRGVAKVQGWSEGGNAIDPFSGGRERVLSAVPNARARELVKVIDEPPLDPQGKPLAAAAPPPSPRPVPGEMGGQVSRPAPGEMGAPVTTTTQPPPPPPPPAPTTGTDLGVLGRIAGLWRIEESGSTMEIRPDGTTVYQTPEGRSATLGFKPGDVSLTDVRVLGNDKLEAKMMLRAADDNCAAKAPTRPGPTTIQVVPGGNKLVLLTRNQEIDTSSCQWTGRDYGSFETTYVRLNPPLPDEFPAGAECPPGMKDYRGMGTKLDCFCTASAVARESTVWGSDWYTDDSNICRAALHAGVVKRAGGPVLVLAAPGRAHYEGTSRNGVTSQDYSVYDGSLRFTDSAGGGPGASRPDDCPVMKDYRGTQKSVTCHCGPSRFHTGTIWGTDVYADDSSVCRAALHAGVIDAKGGVVTVVPAPGQGNYPATSRNGVTSVSYGPYEGSFRFPAR